MKTKLSFVIPCYNSELTIGKVVDELFATMEAHKEESFEIILVNDCSKDNVWSVIQDLAKKHKNIKGICFAKNFGQHAALMAGYRASKGDIVVSLDDDGQTPADEVFSLINKIKEGYDVVYASYGEKKHNAFRNLGTVLNNWMCEKLLGKEKGLVITSFFAAKRFVINEMIRYEHSYPYVPGLVLRTTKSIASVPVIHREREVGASGYNLFKLIALWLNGFTAFSVVPLRLSMFMGMASAGVGFIYMIYIVINKILNPSVPMGWSSTMAIILLLGGMILCVLGMIGEYLGRAYINSNAAPQFVIRETVGDKADDEAY